MNDDSTEFVPSGPIRPGSIYVSYDLHKALGYLAKASKLHREDVVEKVLMAWLEANHKEILDHIKRQHEADAEFQKTVKP